LTLSVSQSTETDLARVNQRRHPPQLRHRLLILIVAKCSSRLSRYTLMHIAPGAADPQHIEHSVQKAAVVQSWTRPSTPLGRQQCPNQRPLIIRQIAPSQNCLL